LSVLAFLLAFLLSKKEETEREPRKRGKQTGAGILEKTLHRKSRLNFLKSRENGKRPRFF